MAGNLNLDELTALVHSGEIDTVLVCFADMQGRLVGKRVTGWFFLEHGVRELHVCDYLLTADMEMVPVPGYAASNWDTGYGDIAVRPDLDTLRRIPWLEATALVLGDCVDMESGAEVPHSPRAILKAQIDRAAALGFSVMIGSELEFYIFDDSFEDAAEKEYVGLKTTGRYVEDYHIFQTTKEEGLIRTIRNGMDGAAVPVEFSKGEWGPGQAEINLRYADALEMADRHVIYKNGAKEIAWAAGKAITFMAKWREDLAGNSCHIHSSLWRTTGGRTNTGRTNTGRTNTDRTNTGQERAGRADIAVFADEAAPEFNHWAAGQMALADGMTYFFAPNINSYKRFQSGSFAPTRTAWSKDNRTAGFRVVGVGAGRRLECRMPGGDCNPYLAFAATIAAGLYGIENKLDPGPMMQGNLYEDDTAPKIPKTLLDALAALAECGPLRAAFGDAVIEHYLHAGRWEQSEFDRCVTDWEVRRLFERG